MSERVETVFTWDTRGVEQGAARIDKAFERVSRSQATSSRSTGRGGDDTERLQRRAETQINRHLRQIEREEAASLARRVQATEKAYASMDKAAEYRRAALVKELKARQLPAEGSHAGGGHGPGGGGGGGGRYVGDLLNMASGTSGNVMRVNFLSHLGLTPLIGGGIASLAGGLAATIGHYSREGNELRAGSERLDESFSESRRRAVFTNRSSGVGEISERIADLRTAGRSELDQQAKLTQQRGERDQLEGFPFHRIDEWMARKTGRASISDLISESRQREGASNNQIGLLQGERSAAYQYDTASTRERLGGSTFAAKRMELQMGEKRALTEAGSFEVSGKDFAQIKEKFALEQRANDLDEEAAKTRQRYALELAEFRGNSEQRTRHSNDVELAQAKDLLKVAVARGNVEEIRAAETEVASRSTAKFENERNKRGLQLAADSSLRRGAIGLGSAQFRLGQDLFSQNENTRFGAGQNVEREQASAGVASAREALLLAQQKLKNEGATIELVNEEKLARQGVAAAQLTQLEVEKKLSAESIQRTRQQRAEGDAARNQTAAMRLSNSGRSDLAAVRSGRDQSEAAALSFERAGRHDLATEAQEQQHQSEVGAYDAKYLRADGRRKRRSDVQRHDRHLRVIEGRRNRANDRLEKNGGLIDVRRDIGGKVIGGTDPLTGERMSADQIASRKERPAKTAANEAHSEALQLAKILEVLDSRLPPKAK
jgi:hypothetical protein